MYFLHVVVPFFDNLVYDYGNLGNNTNNILVNWKITQELRRVDERIDNMRNGGVFFDMVLSSTIESTGQGGSLAQFKIVSDYLYAVDSHNINVFNISNLENPKVLESVQAGFDIETIFNKGNYLFLGSMSGM